MSFVQTGLDRILHEPVALPGRGRIALLCNASTVSRQWVPSAEALARRAGIHLVRILSPQHGYRGEKQDNMVESPDATHPRLGVPIGSLYGRRREPSPEDLEGIDALLIDLQDVGTRVYTFLTTAMRAIRAAKELRIPKVLVLDRPNPIGGSIEGPILEKELHSFVGCADVPLRHGLTLGELCIYAAWRQGLLDEGEARDVAARARGEDSTDQWLQILPLQGWRRSLYHDETGLPWTMPSPNMPALDTAIVYPGQVALEGTSLSEGRGTTRPFELFGAPALDPQRLQEALEATNGSDPLEGAILREVAFEPTFQKHAGRLVRGFQIHVLDRARFRPVRATTAILSALARIDPDSFSWNDPPYEYDDVHRPIDLIYGTDRVRRGIDAGAAVEEIAAEWDEPIAAYRERIEPFRIYGD